MDTVEVEKAAVFMVEITLAPPKPTLWSRFDSWLCSLDKPWIDVILVFFDSVSRELDLFENFLFTLLSVRIFNLRALRLFWDFRECPVFTKDYGSHPGAERNGSYWNSLFRSTPQITIAHNMPRKWKMTVIMHELGHHIHLKGKPFHWYGTSQSSLVKKKEISAWGIAIDLSKKYGIPIDVDDAIWALGTYGLKSARLENLATSSKAKRSVESRYPSKSSPQHAPEAQSGIRSGQ